MGRRLITQRRAVGAVLAAASLFATAGCGARWSGAQHALVLARSRGGGSSTSSGPGGAAGGATTATTTPSGTSGAVRSGGGGAAGAAATSPGAATAGANAAPGQLPCAGPSAAPGVTGDTVTVGNISSISGPIPGLGSAAVGATRAYVAYRNSIGGVCGRKIVLKTADDGADNAQFRALATQMSAQVLGLIGNNAGGDAGGADVIEANKVPAVATAFSYAFKAVSTVFDMNPLPANFNAVIGKYRYLYGRGVRKAALITLAADAAVAQLHQQRSQMIAAGIQIANEQELPVSTLSFDSAARAVANSGADYLFFLSAAQQDASMAQSMADTGYKGLKVSEYLTAYGSNFIQLAGASAEGSTSWIRSLPNEEPNSNAEQATYLRWMAQTAPDVFPDTFAADAWASSKAFFDALEKLSGPISRPALVAELRTFTTYDAGGLEGPINLGHKVSNSCFIAMQVVSGLWKRLAPDKGFLC